MKNKLLISLVLYQTSFEEAASYQLLDDLTANKDVYLFIYDNSTHAQKDCLFERETVYYIHDKTNPGLAKAYNQAKEYLKNIEADLLLLMDQDTQLTDSYIQQLINMKKKEDIVAYVPIIYSHKRQISPISTASYVNGQSKVITCGEYYSEIMAINSGTALTKQFLEELGEFNEAFPLDFLDHWLFWKIVQLNKGISVVDNQLEHHLSVLDYKQMSLERYCSILKAETLFYQKYASNHFLSYKKHLRYRLLKQFFLVKNKKIFFKTLSEYVSLMKGEKQ